MTRFKTQPGTFWNGDSPLQADHDTLHNALVPAEGEASTQHGEMLRLMGNIYYDLYNNGGGNDYAEEVRNLAALLRTNEMTPVARDLESYWTAVMFSHRDTGYDGPDDPIEQQTADLLETVAVAVVVHAKETQARIDAGQAQPHPSFTGAYAVPGTDLAFEAWGTNGGVRVLDEEGDTLFTSAMRIEAAIANPQIVYLLVSVYEASYEKGRKMGTYEAQDAIRRALGIVPTTVHQEPCFGPQQ